MSLAAWCWQLGQPESRDLYRRLPYTVVQLPVKFKHDPIRIETAGDIWGIVDEICTPEKDWSDGQIMYHMVPFFADCSFLIEPWMNEMINEYNYVTRFNVSLGHLDHISAHRLDCFSIIDKEINACMNFKAKKNG